MTVERDDFVSGGGAVAWALVALAPVLMLLLLFVPGSTPAWAGCTEMCRDNPVDEWVQLAPHCCCIAQDETFCEPPTPHPTATACVETSSPVCIEATPTALPTPSSHVKNGCYKEARAIYQAAKRAALVAYRAEVSAIRARRREQMTECRAEYAEDY